MRKRISKLLLMPIFAMLWIFGWGLFWRSDKERIHNLVETEKKTVSVNRVGEQ